MSAAALRNLYGARRLHFSCERRQSGGRLDVFATRRIGIRCWIAPRDVRPGRTWGSEIIRGLDNAKVMIVVLSASSNRSRPVIKEVERAFGKEKVIITVRTEEVVLSQDLEFFLSSDQWLDAITTPTQGTPGSTRCHGQGTLGRSRLDRGRGHGGDVRRAPGDWGADFQRGRWRNSGRWVQQGQAARRRSILS